jgi:hypothetical protein
MITNDSIRWRKGSFSGGGNNECVELGCEWRKSSFSGGENNACVELANCLVAVRDSKNPAGPVLRANMRSLLAAVKHGRLDVNPTE